MKLFIRWITSCIFCVVLWRIFCIGWGLVSRWWLIWRATVIITLFSEWLSRRCGTFVHVFIVLVRYFICDSFRIFIISGTPAWGFSRVIIFLPSRVYSELGQGLSVDILIISWRIALKLFLHLCNRWQHIVLVFKSIAMILTGPFVSFIALISGNGLIFISTVFPSSGKILRIKAIIFHIITLGWRFGPWGNTNLLLPKYRDILQRQVLVINWRLQLNIIKMLIF